MSVQSSPIEPALLQEKVEEVGKRAGTLNSTLLNVKNRALQEFLDLYKELVPLISSFLAVNSMETLNSNAVVLANNIADRGFELATLLNRNFLLSNQDIPGIRSLSDASKDLKSYCNDGRSWKTSIGYTSDGNRSEERATEDQRLARMNAHTEEMERSFIAMEARLKALGESADKSVARIEELTVQQADAMRTTLSREVADIQEGFESTKDALKKRLEEFNVYKDLAEEKISQLGLAALVGGHAKSAVEEQKMANLFRGISLALMAVAIINVGWLLHDASAQKSSLESIIYRAVLSLLLIVPTAYAAKESAKHRAQAIELRRLSLDFAALEPFLKGMQADEAQKTRAELARRAFFNGVAPDANSSYGLDPQAIIMKGIDTIADLAKRKP